MRTNPAPRGSTRHRAFLVSKATFASVAFGATTILLLTNQSTRADAFDAGTNTSCGADLDASSKSLEKASGELKSLYSDWSSVNSEMTVMQERVKGLAASLEKAVAERDAAAAKLEELSSSGGADLSDFDKRLEEIGYAEKAERQNLLDAIAKSGESEEEALNLFALEDEVVRLWKMSVIAGYDDVLSDLDVSAIHLEMKPGFKHLLPDEVEVIEKELQGGDAGSLAKLLDQLRMKLDDRRGYQVKVLFSSAPNSQKPVIWYLDRSAELAAKMQDTWKQRYEASVKGAGSGDIKAAMADLDAAQQKVDKLSVELKAAEAALTEATDKRSYFREKIQLTIASMNETIAELSSGNPISEELQDRIDSAKKNIRDVSTKMGLSEGLDIKRVPVSNVLEKDTTIMYPGQQVEYKLSRPEGSSSFTRRGLEANSDLIARDGDCYLHLDSTGLKPGRYDLIIDGVATKMVGSSSSHEAKPGQYRQSEANQTSGDPSSQIPPRPTDPSIGYTEHTVHVVGRDKQILVLGEGGLKLSPTQGAASQLTYEIASGELAPGLTLQSDGTITGSSTAVGSWTSRIVITSSVLGVVEYRDLVFVIAATQAEADKAEKADAEKAAAARAEAQAQTTAQDGSEVGGIRAGAGASSPIATTLAFTGSGLGKVTVGLTAVLLGLAFTFVGSRRRKTGN